MPKLPIAFSSQQMTSLAPSTKVNPANYRAAGQAIEKVGAVFQQTAKKFQDLQNLEEYTSAMTQAKKELRDLQSEAKVDDDIYTIQQRYGEKIQQIRDRAAGRISDRETQIKFSSELDNLAMTSDFNIRSIARQKQLDRSRATLLNDIDQSKRDFYNAMSPLERKQLQDQVHFRLDEFARLGVIKEEVAAKYKLDWDNEVRLGQVYYDASIDPEIAKDNVEKGIYKLSSDEKEEALNDIASLIQKRETRKKINLFRGFNKKETEIVSAIIEPDCSRIIDGQMSVADLDQLELLGMIGDGQGISKNFATVARRAIKSNKAEDPTVNVDAYNDILDDFVNLKVDKKKNRTKASLEELMRFRVEVMDKYSKGDITSAQMSRFLKDVSNVYADKLDEKAKENVDLADPTPWYKVYRWTDEYANNVKESRVRIAEKMMKKIEDGKTSEVAATEAIEEEKGHNNPIFNLFKDSKPGDIVDTPAGPVKFIKMAPDGEPMIEVVE